MNCSNFYTPLRDESILMKLYTVTVYKLRMCLKDANPDSNYFKGDNQLREIISSAERLSFCDLTHSSSLTLFYKIKLIVVMSHVLCVLCKDETILFVLSKTIIDTHICFLFKKNIDLR